MTPDGSRSFDGARLNEPRSANNTVQASGLPAQVLIVKREQQDLNVDHTLGDKPQVYPDESPERLRMIREPSTRPISPEQLIAEVKGIYAGLIMVEAKCVDVDSRQHQAALDTDGRQKPLEDRQWQALIALHKTLLHEHHDFFLASQHPSASAALRKLAQKYAMPARMWKHAIHSFLELLRHRLPQSLEHMLTFIYISYSMMSLCMRPKSSSFFTTADQS